MNFCYWFAFAHLAAIGKIDVAEASEPPPPAGLSWITAV